MPCKFRRELCKGYSKTKSAKAIAKAQQSGDSDATCSEEESAISLVSTTSALSDVIHALKRKDYMCPQLYLDQSTGYIHSTNNPNVYELQNGPPRWETIIDIQEGV